MPPLCERLGDSVLLAKHFIGLLGAKYNKPGLTLSADAAALIAAYDWPGNVRELRNMMEQSVLHCDGQQLLPELLSFPTLPAFTNTTDSVPDAQLQSLPGQPPADSYTLGDRPDDRLADAEKLIIEQTLLAVNGNISETARRLGITRDRLRYRLKKYGL